LFQLIEILITALYVSPCESV